MKKNKFSIIVPVYNTGMYLKKCIDSILNQSYSNFELIIVNDGSTDNSLDIINSYKNKNIIIINQENMGVSIARNNALKKVSGDYLLFVDSDDYLEKDLLKILNTTIDDEDIIRFQLRKISQNNTKDYKEESFKNLSGIDAFNRLCNFHFVEIAACYAYKTNFFLNNHFEFSPGKYHEDFGLVPYVIISAAKVSSIDYIGYNYVTTNNSITSFTDYAKEQKKAFDVLWHYKNIINKSNNVYYRSFLANQVLLKANFLNKEDMIKFVMEIKKEKVVDNLLEDNFKRKIKKFLLKLNINFIKVFK